MDIKAELGKVEDELKLIGTPNLNSVIRYCRTEGIIELLKEINEPLEPKRLKVLFNKVTEQHSLLEKVFKDTPTFFNGFRIDFEPKWKLIGKLEILTKLISITETTSKT